ncbi:MAG: hypothetical protein KGI60_02890 [Patescibacteria group bacterium]|nr:hypothetical protein [Patescibacteria group bacterium]
MKHLLSFVEKTVGALVAAAVVMGIAGVAVSFAQSIPPIPDVGPGAPVNTYYSGGSLSNTPRYADEQKNVQELASVISGVVFAGQAALNEFINNEVYMRTVTLRIDGGSGITTNDKMAKNVYCFSGAGKYAGALQGRCETVTWALKSAYCSPTIYMQNTAYNANSNLQTLFVSAALSANGSSGQGVCNQVAPARRLLGGYSVQFTYLEGALGGGYSTAAPTYQAKNVDVTFEIGAGRELTSAEKTALLGYIKQGTLPAAGTY